jgi:tetratricopeptide (TPR) repeat protein
MRLFLTGFVLALSAAATLAATDNVKCPADSMATAEAAKTSFDQGDYIFAEELYEQILQSHPDNVYALSNLGVVQFRLQKWGSAEHSLQRAITVAPGDAFSHCTLGIIYYQERLYDKAAAEFNRALAINPKYELAKNYLGVIRAAQAAPHPVTKDGQWLPDPLGDFDTPRERLYRQSPGLPAPVGEIGSPPSSF